MSNNFRAGKKRGAGFFFGRILTAVLGLAIGAGLFMWQALDRIDYVKLQAVKTNSTEGIKEYEKTREKSDAEKILEMESSGNKMGRVDVAVDPEYPILQTKKKDPEVENILVFGVDSRANGEISRADSIIVVTIDKRHNQVKLTSILRDTEISLNNLDGNRAKVNASYAYGGIGMLINTLNSNFDLDISKFVMFDFWSAIGFVDALGGVTLDIAEREVEATNDCIAEAAELSGKNAEDYYLKKAGKQKLNGMQAISWARVRYIDSDFGRTSRQRELMQTILKEFSQRNKLQQASFAVNILGELETNLNKTDLVTTGLAALGALNNIYQYYVPQEGMFEVNYDNWNMIFDPSTQLPALHDFIWGDAGKE